MIQITPNYVVSLDQFYHFPTNRMDYLKPMQNIAQTIAQELNVREQQVNATIALLDDGATVPRCSLS